MHIYKRDPRGRFIKGSKSISYWRGKKREEVSKETRSKISTRLSGVRKTIKHKKSISKSKMGKLNPMYKTGEFKTASGHILVLKKEHPNANNNGRVFKHRLVMERHLGRYLTKDELIHHIDGNPSNNNVNNLHIFNRGKHAVAHQSMTRLIKYLLYKKIIKFNKLKGIYEKY